MFESGRTMREYGGVHRWVYDQLMIGGAFARKAGSILALCVLPNRNFYHFSGSIDKLTFVQN